MQMNDPASSSPALQERGFSTGLYRVLAWLSPGYVMVSRIVCSFRVVLEDLICNQFSIDETFVG